MNAQSTPPGRAPGERLLPWETPEATWTIEPDPASVAPARRRAVAAVRSWCPEELPDHTVAAIERVVSELVTNAIRHAGDAGPITAHLWPTPRGNIAVVVRDGSPTPPTRRDPYNDGTSGYGLAVVASETIAWGWRPHGEGKAVYATIALPGPRTIGARAAALAQRVRDTAPRPAVGTITPRQATVSIA
ncbi:ATP-binding protein [Kitasatospora sp. GP82]|uniref:ATP-binding protein n=1 Tax=Kitasatospora sp. GP82 TaxID=3035089 RepID=UPI0024770E0A|nr:ATP-binding protein [Kitasatospora sp. GP82]MDH6127961.1 hypothetical protein [Kitasatospora sp. GP82]